MLLFGALFSLFERPTFGRPVFFSRYFWHGLVFTTFFNFSVFYAILKFPDWMWMYFVEDSQNSVLELIYIFVFLYYLPYALGFYLGYDIKNRSKVLWAGFAVFLIAAEVWIVLHLFDRYSVVGTREAYLNKTAVSLFDPANPLGPVMNGSVGIMILYFFLVLFRWRRTRSESIQF